MGATDHDNATLPVQPRTSVAVIENAKVPATSGVPVTDPVEGSSVSPVGNAPDEMR